MDLYIDKANLLSFLESHAENMYEDCLKLMRKQLNVNFNFSKDDLKKDENLMLWYRKNFTQGVEDSEIRFESSFPKKPIQSTTSHTFNRHQLSSVYLLEDKNVRELKDTGRVIIGEVGEEIETLHKLFFLQGDYLFDKTWKIGAKSFQKWSDLEPFSLPLTDILIVDPYVVGSIGDCEYNLIPYLESLVKHTRTIIDIVIYTNKEQCMEYSKIAPILKESICNITGVDPNLTIVTYTDRRGVPSRGEHDRTILMNYKRIKSGDTFNYFKSDGTIQTKGREIQYLSLARKENYDLAQELLKDLQGNVDFFKRNRTNIEGDGKSSFLNFN